MKTYYITSDTHSAYNALIEALNASGFDINNSEHIFVLAGDLFDRCTETLDLYKFIQSIPQERRVLIRGNHERLYTALLEKEWPERYDFSNGTVRTFCHIAGEEEEKLSSRYWFKYASTHNINLEENFEFVSGNVDATWNKVKEKVKNSEITKFILSDEWVNYLELRKYIIVHSFIPTTYKNIGTDDYLRYFITGRCPEIYNKNWRKANDSEWNDATWGCPYTKFKDGLYKGRKTLVCGHWHTSDFYKAFNVNREDVETCPIFNGVELGVGNIIALDACTAFTNRCNVFKVEEK